MVSAMFYVYLVIATIGVCALANGVSLVYFPHILTEPYAKRYVNIQIFVGVIFLALVIV